jgi:hypothetical protein
MASNYLIEYRDDITTIRFSTSPGLDDIRNAIDDVVENHLSPLRVWDFSNGFNLTDAELKELAAYGKSKFSIPSRVAVIASNDLAYGVARVYDVYREDAFLEQQIFRTEQEARAWLMSRKKLDDSR